MLLVTFKEDHRLHLSILGHSDRKSNCSVISGLTLFLSAFLERRKERTKENFNLLLLDGTFELELDRNDVNLAMIESIFYFFSQLAKVSKDKSIRIEK